jgi:hypothetical protein
MQVGDKVTNSLVPDPEVGTVTELYTGGRAGVEELYAVVEYEDGREEDVPVYHLVPVGPHPTG